MTTLPSSQRTSPSATQKGLPQPASQVADAVVATVSASDADTNTGASATAFRFANSGGTPGTTSTDGYFSINSSGQISITSDGIAAGVAQNDFETGSNSFTYAIQASSDGSNFGDAVDVTLNVTDIDDNTPVIAANQSFSYAEGQVADAVVATVSASDADTNTGASATAFRFENSGGTPGTTSTDGYFSINSSGQISITSDGIAAGVAQNDFETGSNSFTYAIQASSDGSNFGDAVDVTLNVTDIDDNTPVIAANQSFSYAEGQVADAVVATVSASDADTNTGASPTAFRFENSGGTPGTTSTDGYFSINSSGQISITSDGIAAGVAQNDFETGSNSFTYAIQASSDGSNFGDAVDVTLNVTDIDDNTPVIAANQSFSYAEGQVADAVVATVSASDADTNTGASPTAFRFANSGGTPGTTSTDGYFSINSSGQISITSDGIAAGVAQNDFETGSNSFTYAIQASSDGSNFGDAVDVTLNVTDIDDNTPVIAANQSFSYAEGQVADAVVATVSASDADTNTGASATAFRFENSGGTPGTTSTDGYFSINSSGQISITSDGIAAGVAQNDFETGSNSFTYAIQASSDGSNFGDAVDVTLNVTDIDDNTPVIAANQSFSYAEGQVADAVVATVSASDADTNTGASATAFRFENSGGTPGTTSTDGYFSINSSGQISITSDGIAAGVAQNDFETGSNSFTYAIQASSDGSNFGDAVDVTLNVTDIDDNTPVIAANQSFSYAEGQVADAVVATVSASDADTNTGASATAFRFENSGGTPGTTSTDGYFSINSSGQISITSDGIAAGVAQNDFETGSNSFTYAIQASSDGSNFGDAVDVTLNVTDIDDNTPVIAANQSFSYAEGQVADAVVATVSASDADTNTGASATAFRFENSGGTPGTTSTDGYFSINSSGQISITSDGIAAGVAQNDFETGSNSFTYAIQASSDGSNFGDAVDVTLNVTDIDDNTPVIAANQSFSYEKGK